MNIKTNCAMSASHTPGPLKVIIAEYFAKGMFQIVTDERCPATIAFVCDDIPDGEANARLFAQAPALHDALKAISEVQPSHDDAFSTLRQKLEGCRDLAIIALNSNKP